MSQTFHCRASELTHIDDPYLAYCIDEAVFLWGNHVENEMVSAANAQTAEEAKQPARNSTLQRLLMEPGEDPDEMPTAGQFRDPAAVMFSKARGT